MVLLIQLVDAIANGMVIGVGNHQSRPSTTGVFVVITMRIMSASTTEPFEALDAIAEVVRLFLVSCALVWRNCFLFDIELKRPACFRRPSGHVARPLALTSAST
jgi:hypothetical protein